MEFATMGSGGLLFIFFAGLAAISLILFFVGVSFLGGSIGVFALFARLTGGSAKYANKEHAKRDRESLNIAWRNLNRALHEGDSSGGH